MNQNPFVSSEVETRPSSALERRFSTSLEANGVFSASARQLAGLAGAMFGWRPGEFWNATPDELAAIFESLRPHGEAPAGADVVARLKERFPDG